MAFFQLATQLVSIVAAVSIPDKFITITAVELPAQGSNPADLVLVLKQKVQGCRVVEQPMINQRGEYIQIFPQSDPAQKGRSICNLPNFETTQSVRLGALPRGTYRIRVITEKSQIAKILNVY